jgi:hypothetical protein
MALAALIGWGATRPAEIPFEKHMLDGGANETAAIADVNGDGRLDIIAGENWFEAPRWTRRPFRQIPFFNPRTDNYIDNFSDLAVDVNGDGHTDVVSCSWFQRKLAWWQNPGRAQGAWREHVIESDHNTEFCFLVDLNNDGKAREILPQYGGKAAPLAWYEWQKSGWVRHTVLPAGHGHGIGAGDVNGDGRTDIVTPRGWLEAPADPRSGEWKHHAEFELTSPGFIHVIDINGDGRNDLLSGAAHDYGIYWLEQAGGGKWNKTVIDETWSQVHATTLVDLNGDGRLDVLAGKRYMAHEFRKSEDGKRVEWIRHIIDYSSRAGAGMQLPVADLDGDGDLDFVAPGKSGLFLFENLTKKGPRK